MASKKVKEEPAAEAMQNPGQVEVPGDRQDAGPTAPQRPDSDYVVLVNRSRQKLDLHLLNGRTVPLGPRCPHRTIHRSDPILRKHLSPEVEDLRKRGMIEIEPYQGGN